jgi:hypothetical protein
MKMRIDSEKYKAMRQRDGASEQQCENELTEMATHFHGEGDSSEVKPHKGSSTDSSTGEPFVIQLKFSKMELKIARDLVGSDPEKLEKHLRLLDAYKQNQRLRQAAMAAKATDDTSSK